MTEHSDGWADPSQTIEVAIVDPPAEVAERLALGEGESAVVRRRVRSLDGEPYNINDSYYPLSLAQGTEIMQPGDIARGANEVLTEQGYEQVRALDEFYVRMPTPDEVRRLDLGPGTPIACHVATGITAEDLPVRVVVNVLPGDRHVIVYERAKPHADALTIRRAEPADLPALIALRQESPSGWLLGASSSGNRERQGYIRRKIFVRSVIDGSVYVACDGPTVAATITIRPHGRTQSSGTKKSNGSLLSTYIG